MKAALRPYGGSIKALLRLFCSIKALLRLFKGSNTGKGIECPQKVAHEGCLKALLLY
jgi:hypothetical protein